jgi:hypothetical protein
MILKYMKRLHSKIIFCYRISTFPLKFNFFQTFKRIIVFPPCKKLFLNEDLLVID